MATKIKLEIKNRFTGKVLFSYEKEDNTIRDTVLAAIESHANLSRADLSRADLSHANLSRANLSHANLSRANLSRANLSRANLSRANLSGANLSHANLSGANLSHADLSHANLSGADLSHANLSGANLSHANLSGANLSHANLSGAKEDLFSILKEVPNEINGLRTALVEGKINGTCYEGECACLVGTIAKIRKCSYNNIPGIAPNSDRPAERWFFAIRPGNTPENSQISKITLEWIDEFLGNAEH